jgi:hypothetical protein
MKIQMLLSSDFMVQGFRGAAYRFPPGMKDFPIRNVKTSPVPHRVSYSLGTGGSSPE